MAAAVIIAAVAVLGLVPNSIFSSMFEPFGGMGEAFIDGGPDGTDATVTGELSVDSVTDVSVRYTASIDGSGGDGGYTVELSNRFTDRSQDFTGDTFSSLEVDLRPGMDYTLTLRSQDGTVLATAAFTTEREMGGYFYLASAECTCPVDDLFHIEADVSLGDWRSVRADLTDRYGHTSSVLLSEGSGPAAITVRGAGLLGDTATLRVVCVDASGQEAVLHAGTYMI